MNRPPRLASDIATWPNVGDMPAQCKVERRVVWNLLLHLKAHGFELIEVDDGGEVIRIETEIEAMDAIFAVDDSFLIIRKPGFRRHCISIILGNGIDCISDYNYTRGDPDGFVAAMDQFNEEDYE